MTTRPRWWRRGAAFIALMMIAAMLATIAGPASAHTDDAPHTHDAEVPPLQSCVDKTGVLVASDAQAQSDVLSAITLASATDSCLILAGHRDDAGLAADQYLRVLDSDGVTYIVGGLAAVSMSKQLEAGAANATRIGGADRYETARLVGEAVRAMQSGTDSAGGNTATSAASIAETTAATGSLTLEEGTWTVTVRNRTALTCEPYVTFDGHDHVHAARYDSRPHYADDHPKTGSSDGHAHGTSSGQHSHDGDVSGASTDGKHVHGDNPAHSDHRVTHTHTTESATVYGHTGAAGQHGDSSEAVAPGTRHTHTVSAEHYHGTRHTHGDSGHGSHAHTYSPATPAKERAVSYTDFPITSSYANPGALDDLGCAAAVSAARQAVAGNRNLSKPTAMVTNSGEDEGGFSVTVPYSVDEACLTVDPIPTVTHNPATAASDWAESWTFTLMIPEDCTQTVIIDRNADADTVKSWSAEAKA